MKYSKKDVHKRTVKLPKVKYEDQRLTSFAGLIIYQAFFSNFQLKEKLRSCFQHLKVSSIFGYHTIALILIVHLTLGYRRLRHVDYYKNDPMVLRLLGLGMLPDVSTISRVLSNIDDKSIENVRELCRKLVISRLKKLELNRLTLDFDGTVYYTNGGGTEGTAVGFNKAKKGARSYYPLLCTIAQLGFVFDIFHRPGNVHDSNGSKKFISECIEIIRRELPGIKIEVRMDSAFFNEDLVEMLNGSSVEFTISVPFERFEQLKTKIEKRARWKHYNDDWSYFESQWKPKIWGSKYRFIFIKQKTKKIRKGPVQLDLFIPYEYGFEFKVIITNKSDSTKKVLMFHNGRGNQENIFGELKTQCQMDYIPVRRKTGNQLFILSGILAHNLSRELQMETKDKPERGTTEKRTPIFRFEELATIRHNLLQRAGRFTKPQGKITLTMNPSKIVKEGISRFLGAFSKAA